MLKRALAIAVAVFAAGAVITTPASADEVGTADFFPCPYKPIIVQQRTDFGGHLVLEKCWSTNRNTWMYRANIRRGILNGDQLRTGYTPYTTKGWVPHSYRQAPQDIDANGEMPNEWLLAGNNGAEIQACLTSGLTGTLYCTWP